MPKQIKVYRVNTGSCGGSDIAIEAALRADAGLAWAEDPHEADALLLTGVITAPVRPAFLALWRELGGRVPLVAVGRCSIDGHPFGRGGLAEIAGITARVEIASCPPTPEEVGAAVRRAVAGDGPARGRGGAG